MSSEHTVSISMTVLNAFSDIPSIDARKLPAAPVPTIIDKAQRRNPNLPQMTKSILPNISIVLATASLSCWGCLTSACAGTHFWPVASESPLALSVSLSRLIGGQSDVPT